MYDVVRMYVRSLHTCLHVYTYIHYDCRDMATPTKTATHFSVVLYNKLAIDKIRVAFLGRHGH